MDDQKDMLTQFADLLEKSRARWPNSPTLPKGYNIWVDPDDLWLPTVSSPEYTDNGIGYDAGIALCIKTASEILYWWLNQNINRELSINLHDGKWEVYLGFGNDCYHQPVIGGVMSDIDSTILTALRLIVEFQ